MCIAHNENLLYFKTLFIFFWTLVNLQWKIQKNHAGGALLVIQRDMADGYSEESLLSSSPPIVKLPPM